MPSVSDVQQANPAHLSNNTFLVKLAVTFNVVSIPLAIFILILVCIACVLFIVLIIFIAKSCLRRKYITKRKRKPFKAVYTDEIPGLGLNQQSGGLGILEYTIEYNMNVQRLTVGVIQAYGLPTRPGREKIDPYVSVAIYKEISGKRIQIDQTYLTAHQPTVRPSWNQTFSYIVPEASLEKLTIVFDVLDYEPSVQDSVIGQLKIALNELDQSEYVGLRLEQSRYLEQPERVGEGLGELCLGLCYLSSGQNQIDVYIYEARNLSILHAVPSTRKNHLLVEVEVMGKGKKRLGIKATASKDDLVNPYFNDRLTFSLKKEQINDCVVICRLRRYGRSRIRRTLGYVVVGERCPITAGKKHWEEMTKSHGKSHVMWHSIIPDLPDKW